MRYPLLNTYFIAATVALAAASSQCSTLHADWPSFLGGIERERQSVELPKTWSSTEGLAWKNGLQGHGQSSPVVVGETIYLTAIDGPQKERNMVFAYNSETGEKLWEYVFANSIQVKNDPYTSRAAPTPAADASGVIAFFESGDIVALTPEGVVRWERKLIEDYGKYEGRFGLGASLAQLEDRVFVLADNDGPSYMLAMSKETGETLWKTDRTSRTSWSSPMILTVDGKPQVVASSAGTLDGYDPADGSLLWTMDDVGGNTVASPIAFADGCFLVGASPGRNGENSDGASRSNMAVRIAKEGNQYTSTVLWRNEEATSSFGSPIVYENRAYYVNRAGGMFCIDVNDGKLLYKARIKESTWATPLGASGRIYFFGQTGTTTVIKSGDEHEELAANRLWEPSVDGGGPGGFNAEIQYGVALCSRGLIVRTGENLYMIRGSTSKP